MSYKARHATPGLGAKAARAAVMGAVAAGAASAVAMGAGPAGAATTPTSVTASTYITNHPDGGHGTPSTWAYDDFTRKLTVTPSSSAATDCPNMPTGDTCYDATIADSGHFNAVVGAGSPSGAAGVQISHSVQGTMNGTGYFVLYAPASDTLTGTVPATENDNFADPADPSHYSYNWPELAFADPSAVVWVDQENAYSYTYKDACESWTDSNANDDGQLTTAGNITGNTCVLSHTGPGYVVNVNSGKALDVTNGDFAQGGMLQQWTKGARGGADQQFEIVNESNGNSYLVAVSGGKSYYVTSSAQGKPLTLSTYPSADAVVKRSGPYYEFVNTGLVMDVTGRSKLNGAAVQGYKLLDGTNQQWSLP
ncbi:MAG TPA: RICIN domain-containing protein [Trebonia sp.]